MKILLTEEEYKALVPREVVKHHLQMILFDARSSGINDRSFQLVHMAFENAGRELGFKVDKNWTPTIVDTTPGSV